MEKPPVVDRLSSPQFSELDITVDVLREDLIHPEISGNKYWKLKYYINKASRDNIDTLISFGGAYSNHIHALAYAGKLFGLKTIGFIRGEELAEKQRNPTLADAEKYGMKLIFISRKDYKLKNDPLFLKNLLGKYPGSMIIPEGGGGETGQLGIADMITRITNKYDFIVTAAGTGTTAAGIVRGIKNSKTKVIAVPALNLRESINIINDQLVSNDFDSLISWQSYTFGGYGKIPVELFDFCMDTLNRFGLRLDPVYTSKAFFALNDKISSGYFNSGSRILFVHTGGLQGWRGFDRMLPDKPVR